MRLILVRHGESALNREHRIQGQSNPPLTKLGLDQAKKTATALKDEAVEAIYSSVLDRALLTAQSINHYHQVELLSLKKLNELDVGKLDGTSLASMRTDFPDFFNAWVIDPGSTRMPGGESLPELQNRVWDAMRSILAKNHSKAVIIVSHHFAIQSLLCKLIELDLTSLGQIHIGVASISVLETMGDKFRLVSSNDTCHLGGHC